MQQQQTTQHTLESRTRGQRIYPGVGESIESFLSAVRPSAIAQDELVHWIQVHAPHDVERPEGGAFSYASFAPILEARLRAVGSGGGHSPASAAAACGQSILHLATEQGFTTGKWYVRRRSPRPVSVPPMNRDATPPAKRTSN